MFGATLDRIVRKIPLRRWYWNKDFYARISQPHEHLGRELSRCKPMASTEKKGERKKANMPEANSLGFDLRDNWGLDFIGPCRVGERISIWHRVMVHWEALGRWQVGEWYDLICCWDIILAAVQRVNFREQGKSVDSWGASPGLHWRQDPGMEEGGGDNWWRYLGQKEHPGRPALPGQLL